MPIDLSKINWDKLIAIAEKMIGMSATAGASPDEIKQQIRNPRGRARIRLEREVRMEVGMKPREWNREGPAIMAQIYAESAQADEADVDELLQRGVASANLGEVGDSGGVIQPVGSAAGLLDFEAIGKSIATKILDFVRVAVRHGMAAEDALEAYINGAFPRDETPPVEVQRALQVARRAA